MTREELLKSEEYWLTSMQTDLFNELHKYMEMHNLNRTQLAAHLGVSKGYVTQVLSGDFDHRLSKLIELSLAIGKVPVLQFKDLDEVLSQEKQIKFTVLFNKSFNSFNTETVTKLKIA